MYAPTVTWSLGILLAAREFEFMCLGHRSWGTLNYTGIGVSTRQAFGSGAGRMVFHGKRPLNLVLQPLLTLGPELAES